MGTGPGHRGHHPMCWYRMPHRTAERITSSSPHTEGQSSPNGLKPMDTSAWSRTTSNRRSDLQLRPAPPPGGRNTAASCCITLARHSATPRFPPQRMWHTCVMRVRCARMIMTVAPLPVHPSCQWRFHGSRLSRHAHGGYTDPG